MSPVEGPAGTVVAISGSGFTNALTISINNITVSNYTLISSNLIQLTVPEGAATASIQLTEGSCTANTPSFTVLNSDCEVQGGEIYISEVYDHDEGDYGMIELYNPSNTPVTFNGAYEFQRAGDIGGPISAPYTTVLPGTIGAGETYFIQLGSNSGCSSSLVGDVTLPSGINEDDEFFLVKNSTVIDVARAPDYRGYTIIRNANATAPTATFINTDWTYTTNDCTNLGIHTDNNTGTGGALTTIDTHPQDSATCENGMVSFTVTLDDPTVATFTYQWYILDASGNWIAVTNNSTYSGATTDTLTIDNATNTLNENQYYCEITSATCTLVSNAAILKVTSLEAPTVTVTQPDCNTLSTIEITAPLGATITYSIDGFNYQSATTFTDLATGTYTVYVQNTNGCNAETSGVEIEALTLPTVLTEQGCQEIMGSQSYILEVLPATNNNVTYTWENEQGDTVGSNQATFNVTTYVANNFIDSADFPLTFYATVTSGNCEVTEVFTVNGIFCEIPEGISPNNDTRNDNFDLQGLAVQHLKIFNRYGTEVYQKNNYTNQWHGQTDNGQALPTGTYFYYIQTTTGEELTGYVYVNREN
ncbi:hypothetical protein Y10_26870 [Neptunitalea sp. Y10]|uniref:Gliding motility-associated C-terminal domain-containing protein n=2 Tax=Neptunitalea lumnitzerae TaxID=2965509 RepID=A0ABQ5MLR0_9FLAO|nr:hypothetical protein Y10_26870 [Neptunitalea sp. Y10]